MLTSRLLRGGALLFATFGIVSCGSDLSTGVIVKDLNGSWTELGLVIGSSEHWTLATRDTVVTGTGSWTAEACCGGTVTISGYVKGDSVHLVFIHSNDPTTLPPGPVARQFHGTLATPTMLVGNGVRFKKD
jgi:hypothetical protein